jgi:hypothetical protein
VGMDDVELGKLEEFGKVLVTKDPAKISRGLANLQAGNLEMVIRAYKYDTVNQNQGSHMGTLFVDARRVGNVYQVTSKGSLYEYDEQALAQQMKDMPQKSTAWNFLRLFGGATVSKNSVPSTGR